MPGSKRLLLRVRRRLPVYLAALVILVATMGPAYWLFASAISYNKELTLRPPHWIPLQPTLERINAILFAEQVEGAGIGAHASPGAVFRHSILNSTIVATSTTLLCLFLGSLAAYAFTRLRFPMKGGLLIAAISAQMIPPIALLLPMYQVIKALHLMDTLASLVILHSSFVLVYVVWVMSGYFKTIPLELEEAAAIDGCSRLGALFRVVMPLSVPGLFATGLLSFLMSWDEFMYALIFTSSANSKTITVAIGEFSKQYQIDYGMMMAGGVLASVVPVLIALIFQRSLMRGLTMGSVKG